MSAKLLPAAETPEHKPPTTPNFPAGFSPRFPLQASFLMDCEMFVAMGTVTETENEIKREEIA